MKKIKIMIKKNSMLLLGIILGGVIFGGGVYAVTVASSTVSYDNSTSGLSATNVQSAIDELYSNTTILKGVQAAAMCGINMRTTTSAMSSTYITDCKSGTKTGSASFATAAGTVFGALDQYCYLLWLQDNQGGWPYCCSGYCSAIGGDSTCSSYCSDINSIVKEVM